MTRDSAVYDRTVDDDGTVTVPTEHGASLCSVHTSQGMIIAYTQVQLDGTVDLRTDKYNNQPVTVTIPGDDKMEEHDDDKMEERDDE